MDERKNILLETGTNELEVVEIFIDEILEDGTEYRGYYGINVAKVLEIIRLPVITLTPDTAHPCAIGTFTLRNRTLPLVNIATYLGKTIKPFCDNRIIVCEFSGAINAFLVSGVNRIHRIDWENVEIPTENLFNFSNETIVATIQLNDKILFMLDMERIFSSLNLIPNQVNITPSNILEYTEYVPKKKWKILIVDDSKSILSTLKGILEKLGYTVFSAQSGKKAWAILKKCKEDAQKMGTHISDYINAVVTDIEMPEMDGHALTKLIKKDNFCNTIPVVVYSSIMKNPLLNSDNPLGADEQINKPDVEELLQTLIKILEKT
ncbi:MAG: chemotaxis protein CheV [Desulfovibrionaceae bacterium]